MTDLAVIGRGLWGTAAAMHAAQAGASVTLIGPSEPADPGTATGPFASHHDSGRITRSIAGTRLWARLSIASIARYRALEEATGIAFYMQSGGMMASTDPGYMGNVFGTAEALGHTPDRLDDAALAARFPMFRFPEGTKAAWDPTGGAIDPRAMRAAHEVMATRAGATVLDATATAMDGTNVTLSNGGTLAADRILVATGAYAALDGLLPDPPKMDVAARTVLFVDLDDAQADALTDMPSLIFQPPGMDHYAYLLPPICYPDGRLRLKIGGEARDRLLTDADAARAWFHGGGSAAVGDELHAYLAALMPGLDMSRTSIGACILALTPADKPYVVPLSETLTLATACNGAGAKCADEIGRIAAMTALGHPPDPELATLV